MKRAGHDSASGRRASGFQFIATFAVLAATFYAAALWPPGDRFLSAYLEGNALVVNALLRALGQDTHLHGVTIICHGYGIAVRRGCDGIEPSWIFASAVLAFPASMRRKAAALACGVGLILGANLVRILTLFFIGSRWPGLFPFAHLEIWPAAFMALVIGIWLWWVSHSERSLALVS